MAKIAEDTTIRELAAMAKRLGCEVRVLLIPKQPKTLVEVFAEEDGRSHDATGTPTDPPLSL